MQKVALFIQHQTLPGKRDKVKSVWEQYMQPLIAQNEAHEAYYYCFNNDDPNSICVYQQYSNYELSQAFLKSTGYADYLREVESLLAGPPDVITATPVWSKST